MKHLFITIIAALAVPGVALADSPDGPSTRRGQTRAEARGQLTPQQRAELRAHRKYRRTVMRDARQDRRAICKEARKKSRKRMRQARKRVREDRKRRKLTGIAPRMHRRGGGHGRWHRGGAHRGRHGRWQARGWGHRYDPSTHNCKHVISGPRGACAF